MSKHFRLTALVFFLLAGCSSSSGTRGAFNSDKELTAAASTRLNTYLKACSPACAPGLDPQSAVDTVYVSSDRVSIHFEMNDAFAQIPFRDDTVEQIYARVESALGPDFEDLDIGLFVRNQAISELVPNYFRTGSHTPDEDRRPTVPKDAREHVKNVDRPAQPTAGLEGRHIAIWPSHGWYYEAGEQRWEWQRSRLFQTVEDIFPMSFIAPYLAPMLERAGARVYMPRERDPQFYEDIIDNDDQPRLSADDHSLPVPTAKAGYVESDSLGPWYRTWRTADTAGYATGTGMLEGAQNPFALGTFRVIQTDSVTTGSSAWLPDVPARGEYAVYVSYGDMTNAAPDARYTVHHLGGQTSFLVDQTMGGGTWTYLGTFLFESGVDIERGLVTLENESAYPGTVVSGDGVRFGGGMGNVVRGQSVSGRPRFTEGARYYMQFSGMPDTLVYNVTESLNDYVDDYRGRAEWVNYLRGAPAGPNKNRDHAGLGIPIDLSLAFHTDAGITPDSSTIGTLMIYSTTGYESEANFPDGMSRFANRDFGDIMQTQIVDDLRALHDSTWTRRSLWDRDYSEAVRPNIPGVLLELQSHQNFADMKFGLDPTYRADVSRAMYKAMLRFLANQDDAPYVVQPLPVHNLNSEWVGDEARPEEGALIRISWRETVDRLEESASANGFIVYRRNGDTGFDNGVFTPIPEWTVRDLQPGVVTSFRVSAVNNGGESRWSNVISVGIPSDMQLIEADKAEAAGTVLIVDNFDRISGPGTLDVEGWKGFMSSVDEGVPDGIDVSYVGEQYDFDPNSPYIDDDAPGHGASYATFETWPRVGNTRDYAAIHADAVLNAGYRVLTSSGGALRTGKVDLGAFDVVDVILGEQRRTALPGSERGTRFETFSSEFQRALRDYTRGGGALLVSGAYVGTDLSTGSASKDDRAFAKDVLKMKYQTDHASQTGRISNPAGILATSEKSFQFNVDARSQQYRVESPDAITPAFAEGETLLRYAENGSGAAIGDRSTHPVVVFGFPFESLIESTIRHEVMSSILNYLTQ